MRLVVKIEIPDYRRSGHFKELFRNSFAVDDSLQYDYQGLIRGLKLLFPEHKNLIINLSIVNQ